MCMFVLDLSLHVAGFAFVVDVTHDNLHEARDELRTFISDEWIVPSAPLLVLLCTDSDAPKTLAEPQQIGK